MTVQYDSPIRVNMPIRIGIYTFHDENGAAINLTTTFIATSVKCEIKRQGTAYSGGTLLDGALVSAAAGTVDVPTHEFTVAGVWTYQFYCLNAAGKKLWGEPVQFEVFPNVEDLTTNQLTTQ